MKQSENLLVDCLYIRAPLSSSSSLQIYGIRMIQGLLRYSHYKIHVLVWREKEEEIDHLVGLEYEKIVLDRSDVAIKWRALCKVSGYLPRKLKQEVRRRNITKVLHPFHYNVIFFFPRNILQFGIVHDMFLYDLKAEKGMIFYFFWRKYQRILLNKFAGG